MAYEQILNLNLGFQLKPSITVVQYDSSRTLHCYIQDFPVPLNSTVTIYVKKPSGHEVYNPCTYQDNLVITPGTLQMFAEVGTSEACIQIITDGKYLTSFPFQIIVTENLTANTTIASTDEYNIAQEVIVQGSAMISAEQERVAAEQERAAAEAERQAAEEERESLMAQLTQTAEEAEENAQSAATQAAYAKEQGDYAKQQAERIEETLDGITINLDYQHQDNAQAYLVGTKTDGNPGIYDDGIYLTETPGEMHVTSLEIGAATISYDTSKSALKISFN